DCGGKPLAVLRAGGPEADVDHVGAMGNGGVERPLDGGDVGRERAPEHLDRDELGVRRLLADRCGDGRAVAETVRVVAGPRAVFVDGEAGGNAVHVRMRFVYTAVDDRDTHAAPGPLVQIHVCRSPERLALLVPLPRKARAPVTITPKAS